MLKEMRSNLSIQIHDNGYSIEYSGTLEDDTFKTFRAVCSNLEDLVLVLESFKGIPLDHY